MCVLCDRSPVLAKHQKLPTSTLAFLSSPPPPPPPPPTHTHTHTQYRAMEKRVSRLVSECEGEAEQKRARESRILDLEKELTILRHEQKEVGRKLGAQQEEKMNVSGGVSGRCVGGGCEWGVWGHE